LIVVEKSYIPKFYYPTSSFDSLKKQNVITLGTDIALVQAKIKKVKTNLVSSPDQRKETQNAENLPERGCPRRPERPRRRPLAGPCDPRQDDRNDEL
jgi:hypothetical protein